MGRIISTFRVSQSRYIRGTRFTWENYSGHRIKHRSIGSPVSMPVQLHLRLQKFINLIFHCKILCISFLMSVLNLPSCEKGKSIEF